MRPDLYRKILIVHLLIPGKVKVVKFCMDPQFLDDKFLDPVYLFFFVVTPTPSVFLLLLSRFSVSFFVLSTFLLS